MICIEIETNTCPAAWCIAPNEGAEQALKTAERESAIRACLQLAEELEEAEPQRAQRLRQVAEDPQRTTAERWGAFKDDDRQPREGQQAAPDRGDGRQR